MRVSFGLEELESQVYCLVSAGCESRRGGGMVIHVKTGDSRSCTSLSIWMRMLTVISSSALSTLVTFLSREG